jgi:hypothetical protein
MEWAQSDKILPALPQRHVFADDADDVRLLFYFVRE